ncbi:MAG: type II toxin-antitoxin system RelB/DinJ family antitoxin [Raoultibacter sp.]
MTTSLTVSMDEGLKEAFADFCKRTGMNPSVAINIFASTVVQEQRIPFEISTRSTSEREHEKQLIAAAWRGYEDIMAGNIYTQVEAEAKLLQLRAAAGK